MSKQNIFSIPIALIPLSYIIGNFLLNLNTFFIILTGIFLYLTGNKIKLLSVDKLIILFFLYILFTGTWNTIELYYFQEIKGDDFTIIIKSLLFLRYLFLYLTIRLLVEKDLINYKIVFYTFALFSFFVSVDIIFQFFYGKDFLGLTSPYTNKMTGPFYSEAIAGGFIQKFSFFLFFTFLTFVTVKNINSKILILVLLFLVTMLSIILSGNRMSLLLFLLSIFLVFINNKNLKKYILHLTITAVLISSVTIFSNDKLKNYYDSFYEGSKKILTVYSYKLLGHEKHLRYSRKPPVLHEFESGVDTWELNKYIGGGLKSFRYNCPKRKIESVSLMEGGVLVENVRTTCNIHPHNYYLEILTDLGIVGMLFFLPIIILAIKKSYNLLYDEKIKYIISPFFYVFVVEVFPIRASGSFFTTNNATIIFFLLGAIVAFSSRYKNKI